MSNNQNVRNAMAIFNNGQTSNNSNTNGKKNCPPPSPNSLITAIRQMAEKLRKAGDVAAARFFEMAAATMAKGVSFSKTLKAGVGKIGEKVSSAASTLKNKVSSLSTVRTQIANSNLNSTDKKKAFNLLGSIKSTGKRAVNSAKSLFTRKTNKSVGAIVENVSKTENQTESTEQKASRLQRMLNSAKGLSNATRKAAVSKLKALKEASGKLAHTMKSSASLAGRKALAVGATAAYGATALGTAAVGSLVAARNRIRNTVKRYKNERQRIANIKRTIYGMTPAQLERLKATLGPEERRAIAQARSGSVLNNMRVNKQIQSLF